jgi:hypothetical protein
MRAVHETVRKTWGPNNTETCPQQQPGYEQAKYMPSKFLPENMTVPQSRIVSSWNLETLSYTNRATRPETLGRGSSLHRKPRPTPFTDELHNRNRSDLKVDPRPRRS